MNFSFVTNSCKVYPQKYVTSETHTLLPPVILCHLLQVSVSQHIAMFSPWFQVSYANYMDVVNWVHAISKIFTRAYLLQGAHYTYLAHSTLSVWFIDI